MSYVFVFGSQTCLVSRTVPDTFIHVFFHSLCLSCDFRVFMLHSFHRFANASKSIHCTPCGNTGASQAGATLCGLCDAGQYMLNQVCTDCAPGYASVYGQANCTECKQGKFANKPRRATVCSACDAGTYNNQTQQTDEKVCLDCPSGRYSSATGVSDVDLCKLCTFDSLFTLFGRENGTHTHSQLVPVCYIFFFFRQQVPTWKSF